MKLGLLLLGLLAVVAVYQLYMKRPSAVSGLARDFGQEAPYLLDVPSYIPSEAQPFEKPIATSANKGPSLQASWVGAPSDSEALPTYVPGQTKEAINPEDLLPQDKNSLWAQVNPEGTGSLAYKNFLEAGYHVGIDTIGSSKRNANHQLRPDIPNPKLDVGPWQGAVIDADTNISKPLL